MSRGLGSAAVVGTNEPDNLIAGVDVNLLTFPVTIKTGQGILVRGTVIGIETATGKGKITDANSVDGSEKASYILAENNIDTSSGDVLATCYKTGSFSRKALTFGENGAPHTIDDDFRAVGIHLVDEY